MLKKLNYPFLFAGISFSIFVLSPMIGFTQSAIKQLENMSGQTIDRSNNSSTTSDYAANRQAWREYREEQRRSKSIQLNNQGNAEYRKGNWDAAYKLYKEAHRLNPSDKVIYNNYLDVKKKRSSIKKSKKLDKGYEKGMREMQAEKLKQQEDQRKKQLAEQLAKEKADKEYYENKIKEAQTKISALQKNITGIQHSLKVYSKSLQNNGAEFEKWGNTVDEAYKNVIENTKDEIKDYFIKISLLAAFGPATQKAAFTKIRSILQSNDPRMQKWLVVEAKLKGITPDKVEDLIDKVEKGFDLNDMLKGEQAGIKPKLDAMLFVNSLFETFNICDYKKLMEKEKLFGSTEIAGEYFDKARLIGETYTDLASICYSWFMIDKLSTDNEALAQKVDLLSFNMQYQMKQIDCLKKCIKDYSKFCNEKCTGVTRFSTPPPLLK